MFLSIATTKSNAKDLGFLLYKHPDRVFVSSDRKSSKVRATGFYPEATDERCEFCLLVEVDPVERVRGLSWGSGIAQYVEPLPYLAGSYVSQAISMSLSSAMNGSVKSENPDTEERLRAMTLQTWPLEIKVGPVRTSRGLIHKLFEPLGWEVAIESVPLNVPGGLRESDLHTVVLTGAVTVQDALTHLYVLLPALDPNRHYFYAEGEVDKLLDKSHNWLETHPAKEIIVGRYLSKSRELRETAFQRLDEAAGVVPDEEADGEEEIVKSAHEHRHEMIVDVVKASGASRIADLGCGEGKLLESLSKLQGSLDIVGVDPSMRSLDKAKKALSRNVVKKIDPRITLFHGTILYSDKRLKDFDVAILSEVIEHVEPERLDSAERNVFGFMAPKTVVLTTPNGEYNAVFGMAPGKFRHRDHRFEWSRAEAKAWCDRIAAAYGYTFELAGAGDHTEEYGHLSHFIVFRKV